MDSHIQNIRDCRLGGVLRGGQTTFVLDHEIFSRSEWVELVNQLSLSPRQAEVIRHLFLGHSDKQIAMELEISVPTVRTHLSRLFSKFDLQDRTELILYVFRKFRKNSRAD